jgi:hypothetical protein
MDNTLRNDYAGALTANVWETPPRQGCSRSGSAVLPASALPIISLVLADLLLYL